MGRIRRWLSSSERGQVLVLTALSMTALLGMAGFVFDSGQMTVERRRMQNAADAAALAGVQVLPGSPGLATTAARQWASNNSTTAAEVTSVDVLATSSANDSIRVRVARNVPYSLMRVLGLRSGDVRAEATARVGSVASGSGVMPFGLLDLNGPGTPGFGYTFGQEVTLKEAPSNFFGPGNYGFLTLDSSGGSTMRDTLARGGSQTVYKAGDQISTLPGQKTGPIQQGLDAWTASHGDSMNSTCNSFASVATRVDGKLEVQRQCSYRLILIPIINTWPNGNKPVTILGFATMYLESWTPGNGKELRALFISDSVNLPNTTIGPINDYGTRIVKLVK